jgi:nitrogen-specific signal transduction histidine kinase
VDEDIEKQIFVPFFTTKVEGSGVGLALTRQVMIAHGGMVKLEKSPLGDTLFRLIF